MKQVANICSFIFHPLFLLYALVVFAYWTDRFGYYINEPKAIGVLLIMAFFLLVLFPLIGIAMLAGLKMISGVSMKRREDRIGPLIITLSFYIWFYVNVNGNAAFPDSLRFVALGAALSVAFAFFINNFSKISLHAIGASSLCASLGFLLMHQSRAYVDIGLFNAEGFRLSAIFVLFLCIVVAGIVGFARLYLKAHRPEEVYGGYVVGILAQIIAFRIVI